jgi:hypothetical protein
MKLKKGSAAAKAFMTKIRAKKGTVGILAKTKKGTLAKKLSIAQKNYNKEVDAYKYFVVVNNKVELGFEYKSDAEDMALDFYPKGKVYTKIGLKKLGIQDPSGEYKYKLSGWKKGNTRIIEKGEKPFKTFKNIAVKRRITIKPKGSFKSFTNINGINKNMIELNPYKIYWNVLMPIKGKLYKTDQIKINKFLGQKGTATKMYPYSFIDGILYTFG